MEKRVYAVLIATVLLAIILIIGMSAAMMQPLYTNQTPFTVSYKKPFAANYWKSAFFNNPQGEELAFFTFAFRSTNQSLGPVMMTASFGPNEGTVYLDSVKLVFASSGPLYWPDIGYRVPAAGTLSATRIESVELQQVTISYENLGFFGQATNKFDLWFGVVGAGSSSNRAVSLTVDLTAHDPGAVLIGQSYSGQSHFPIVIEPNGSISVSDQ